MLHCIYYLTKSAGPIVPPLMAMMRKMINGFEDVQKYGRENVNRAVESLSAISRGWQSMAAEAAGFSKQSLEAGAEHFEKLLGAKTLDVAVATQTDFLKASYEKAFGQAARLGEIYLEAVRDAAKPFDGIAPTFSK
jgi:hypothetical protein